MLPVGRQTVVGRGEALGLHRCAYRSLGVAGRGVRAGPPAGGARHPSRRIRSRAPTSAVDGPPSPSVELPARSGTRRCRSDGAHVYADDLGAHFARTRASGATILAPGCRPRPRHAVAAEPLPVEGGRDLEAARGGREPGARHVDAVGLAGQNHRWAVGVRDGVALHFNGLVISSHGCPGPVTNRYRRRKHRLNLPVGQTGRYPPHPVGVRSSPGGRPVRPVQ
jgi:hypothetical protein